MVASKLTQFLILVSILVFGYFIYHITWKTEAVTKALTKPVVKPRRDVVQPPPDMVKNKTFKIINLTETSDYDVSKWFGFGKKAFEICPYSNCEATYKWEEYNTSDAGIFHMRKILALPKYRPPGQKWIMNIRESPIYETVYGPNYTTFNGIFNATWTYSSTSDINFNYSSFIFVPRKTPLPYIKNFSTGKTKLVAIFMGNCWALSKRLKYVKNLQKYIPVDIYGECGPLKCVPQYSRKCDELLRKHYKFYLSFENSICVDYVTEKLERAIKFDTVPVVLGGANYSSFLPAHSYIDVKDFRSPKELSNYLKMLDENDAKYNEYFQWKKLYKLQPLFKKEHCNLCEYLNKSYKKTKVYDRLDKFWSKSEWCFSPEKFYKNVDKSSWHN